MRSLAPERERITLGGVPDAEHHSDETAATVALSRFVAVFDRSHCVARVFERGVSRTDERCMELPRGHIEMVRMTTCARD